jgi:hypothetical protein
MMVKHHDGEPDCPRISCRWVVTADEFDQLIVEIVQKMSVSQRSMIPDRGSVQWWEFRRRVAAFLDKRSPEGFKVEGLGERLREVKQVHRKLAPPSTGRVDGGMTREPYFDSQGNLVVPSGYDEDESTDRSRTESPAPRRWCGQCEAWVRTFADRCPNRTRYLGTCGGGLYASPEEYQQWRAEFERRMEKNRESIEARRREIETRRRSSGC